MATGPSQIVPGVWVASEAAAVCLETLVHIGAGGLVRCGAWPRCPFRSLFRALELPVDEDGGGADTLDPCGLLPAVESASDFIERTLAAGDACVVYCQTGATLSPAVVAGWLMSRRGLSLRAAIRLIRGRRRKALPGVALLCSLAALELEARGELSVHSPADLEPAEDAADCCEWRADEEQVAALSSIVRPALEAAQSGSGDADSLGAALGAALRDAAPPPGAPPEQGERWRRSLRAALYRAAAALPLAPPLSAASAAAQRVRDTVERAVLSAPEGEACAEEQPGVAASNRAVRAGLGEAAGACAALREAVVAAGAASLRAEGAAPPPGTAAVAALLRGAALAETAAALEAAAAAWILTGGAPAASDGGVLRLCAAAPPTAERAAESCGALAAALASPALSDSLARVAQETAAAAGAARARVFPAADWARPLRALGVAEAGTPSERLPEALAVLRDRLRAEYRAAHRGRRLLVSPVLGTAELRVALPDAKRPLDITLPTPCAALLLALGNRESAPVSELVEESGVPEPVAAESVRFLCSRLPRPARQGDVPLCVQGQAAGGAARAPPPPRGGGRLLQ
eukprot:TRINITY_DN8036_c0_g1_i10.p1 TRINITY_DN8036_c0_g1~~TRINITY_DN8036_c0_g1_i10.p1  ORF type:complete len:597 (+),score=178.12 TRINITY_DN8036_c0_g1_i10:61-1791(+)